MLKKGTFCSQSSGALTPGEIVWSEGAPGFPVNALSSIPSLEGPAAHTDEAVDHVCWNFRAYRTGEGLYTSSPHTPPGPAHALHCAWLWDPPGGPCSSESVPSC